jgi:hypothetical protein
MPCTADLSCPECGFEMPSGALVLTGVADVRVATFASARWRHALLLVPLSQVSLLGRALTAWTLWQQSGAGLPTNVTVRPVLDAICGISLSAVVLWLWYATRPTASFRTASARSTRVWVVSPGRLQVSEVSHARLSHSTSAASDVRSIRVELTESGPSWGASMKDPRIANATALVWARDPQGARSDLVRHDMYFPIDVSHMRPNVLGQRLRSALGVMVDMGAMPLPPSWMMPLDSRMLQRVMLSILPLMLLAITGAMATGLNRWLGFTSVATIIAAAFVCALKLVSLFKRWRRRAWVHRHAVGA